MNASDLLAFLASATPTRQASMGLPQAQVVSRLNASRWMEGRP